jgi:lipid A disaccharide synthetase
MTLSTFETAILTRVVLPDAATLTPIIAESVLSMEFTDADRCRMNELSSKVQEGTLSSDEQTELDSYERVGHFLSLLKSKARRSLQRAAPQP